MIGNDKTRLGWFRDARCEPPDWPAKPVFGQTVTMDAPGDSWQVEFIDAATGKPTGGSPVSARDGHIRIVLPEFAGSLAVRMKRVEATQ